MTDVNNESAPGYAWVTGGGSGIGKALVLRLATAGWQVAISGRNLRSLQAVAAEAPAGRIETVPLDVTEAQTVRRVVEESVCRSAVPDLVVLNAGDYAPMPLDEFDAGLFEHLMRVNYLGVVNCLAAVMPHLLGMARGEILVNGSLSGYRGLPNAAPYGASKAALINMCESLRPELRERGVALRVVNPGFVKTGLTDKNDFDMPALIDARQAAEYIFEALRQKSFEISFPWRFAMLMKLLRMLPDSLFFMLTRRMVA